jgi:hypothetical protein
VIGVVGQEQDTLEGPTPHDIVDRILQRIADYAKARGHRVSLVAVSGPLDPVLSPPSPSLDIDGEDAPSFLSRVWLDLDAIPFLALCKDTQFSLAGEAVHAIELALEQLSPTTTSIIKASVSSGRREVLGACVVAHIAFDVDMHLSRCCWGGSPVRPPSASCTHLAWSLERIHSLSEPAHREQNQCLILLCDTSRRRRGPDAALAHPHLALVRAPICQILTANGS